MPRTVLVFINDDRGDRRREEARDALSNYWRALEGTLDEEKVQRATNNALVGDAERILEQMRERFHPEDRLMLWFDFNNHDSKRVMKNMSDFMTTRGAAHVRRMPPPLNFARAMPNWQPLVEYRRNGVAENTVHGAVPG